MKILVTIVGLWPPSVTTRGIGRIFGLFKSISKTHTVHFLTCLDESVDRRTFFNWVKEIETDDLKIHYFETTHNAIPLWDMININIAFYRRVQELNHEFEYDIIHEFSSYPLLVTRTGIYKKFFQGKLVHSLCTHNQSLLGKIEPMRLYSNNVDIVTYGSCSMKLSSCNEEKQILLPIGVNTKQFKKSKVGINKLRKKYRLEKDKSTFAYIGPYESKKGIVLLEEAVSKLSENSSMQFIIATQGVRYSLGNEYKIRKTAFKKSNAANIQFVEGIVDVREIMSVADVVILPYKSIDGTLGYPSTLLEAMLLEKTIITTDVAGVNELINETNGILVPPDRHSIAFALRQADAMTRKQRNDIGKKAKKTFVDKQLDMKYSVDILNSIYEK